MRHIRKILKVLSIALAALLVLVMTLVLLLSRGVFNDRLAGLISTQGTERLRARVQVQSIQGNPLSSFSVNGIRAFRRDTAELSLDSLKVDYRIGALIYKKVHIENLQLKGFHLYGIQRSDSSWSFEEVLPEAGVKQAEPDTAEPSVPWEIRLDRLTLDDVSASLSPLDTCSIPSSLSLQGAFSFVMGQDSMKRDFMEVALDRLTLHLHSPDLTLSRMQGRFRKVKNRFSWQEVSIDFTGTHLMSSGRALLPGGQDSPDEMGATAQLDMAPLSLQEFHPWMGGDRIYGTPRITVDLRHDGDRQSMHMELEEGDQFLSVSGWIRKLMTDPSYNMTLLTRELDGYHWTRDTSLRSSLSGKVHVKGKGFDMKHNELDLSGKLSSSGYREYRLDDLSFQAGKNRDTIRGSLQGNTWFGGIRSDFDLQQIFDQPAYAVNVALRHLDVSRLAGDTALRSDLNLALEAEGQGIEPDSLQARVEVDLRDSRFMDQPLKDMHTVLDYNRLAYHIRGLKLNSPYFSLELQGEGHVRARNRLKFGFTAGDVQSFTRRTGLPEITLDGDISGKAEGTLDSMDIAATYQLNHVHYDTTYVKRLEGNASALLSRDSLLGGELHLSADSSYAASQWIEKIALHSSLEREHIQNRLDVHVNDSLSLNTQTDLTPGRDPLILIRMFNLHIDTATWRGGSDSTRIALGRDSLDIDHWVLRSGKQEVGVDGTYRFRGEENMHFWVERLDMGQWSALLQFPYQLSGSLNSEIRLEGTAFRPRLEGRLDIENPGLDTVQLKRIHTGFRYDSSVFSLEGYVDAGIHRMIRTRAEMPLEFSLTDSLVMPGKGTPIQASLLVDSLDVSLVNPFLKDQGMEVQGMLDFSVNIAHTLGEPRFNGEVHYGGGTFSYPAEGIRYQKVNLDSRFNNRRFNLDQAHLESGGGFLNMQGYAELPFSESGASDSLGITIKGKDFEAVHSGRLEVVIEPSVTLQGTFSEPLLQGDLKIPRALVNVDAFRQGMAVSSEMPNPPLLIEAMEDTLSVTPVKKGQARKRRVPAGADFYRNLKGTFNIRIPGNTWVKGNDMNFEVQGNLKAIKESEQTDLFGTLNVKRGFFQFYGKKFDFEQGEIIFTGGREIDPRVHFVIAYVFRDADRERQRLTIEVTGRTRQPNLQFSLNEQVIEEKEALSYLMFGKSTNQLTTAEQTSLEERTGQMATSFALDRISTAVTKALGAGLDLDMVELEAGKNWKSGNVKIGKYITDDLYLSYQRTFAFDKREKAIDADRITLEYQIMRSLFIQATNQMYNSGFDLIFKKSWR